MLEASLYMIHAMIVHAMATWETAGAKEDRRRPMRLRSRRPRVGHGVRIAGLNCMRARAAAALHQLQRGLPELLQLLAGHGRERLHRGHERRELLQDGGIMRQPQRNRDILTAFAIPHAQGKVIARCVR